MVDRCLIIGMHTHLPVICSEGQQKWLFFKSIINFAIK
jgi:hypothetical protein